MKELMSKKSVGFYFIMAAGIAAVVSIIRFMNWAPANKSMDAVVLAALIAGLLSDVILIIYDQEFLVVFATACYSISMFKLLVNSVGSFVDAFQGITMFGDASQVGTIVSISSVMMISIVLSVAAGFLKRVKE